MLTEQEKQNLWNKIQSIKDEERKYQLTLDYHRKYGKIVSICKLI